MKKILLSCACCLLAVGLLAGCDEDVEDVTPDDPNTGVVEPGGDGGEDGDGTGEGGEATTYLFGVEVDGVLSYITGATQSQGAYRGVLSADVSEAVAISCEQSESTYYLSFDNEGVTNWITIVSGDHTNLSYATEKSPIYLHTTDVGAEYFGDEDGENFLCYNKTYDCLYASSVDSYLESSPVAGLYTTDGKLVAGGIGEEPEPDPEPVGTMVEVETGVLGLYQGNKGNYYYFTGEINSSNFGVLSADYSLAAAVTVWKDEVYYYLTIGSESELKYISCPDTSATAVALISEPYCLQYDEEHDAWLTGNGKRFLATYSNYETMSWAETERYIDDESEFIAHIYNEEQKLPAPEAGSITISGATSVYVDSTITLTASVPTGYDSSVEWSIDNSGYATIEESSGLTCVVKGVSEGSATVTVKSTANPEAYATTTISVVPVPTGVTLLGSFDFSTSTIDANTIISEDSALDEFWTSTSYRDLYLGAREHDTVYFGNSSGGAFGPTTQYLKFGNGSGESAVDGLLQLKFAVGTSISEVVVTAHSWNASETDTLAVNGTTQNCSQSGSVEALTYTIIDEWTYLLTMESSGRVFVQTIEIYGTYDSENVPYPDAITITPETTETLNVGESDSFTVSWEAGKVFDIDTLTWTSTAPEVVSVEPTTKGATAHALAVGTATISASDGTITSNTVSLTVEDVLEESEIINISDYGGNGTNVESQTITAHQVSITIAKGSGGTSPRWDSNKVRVYANNTITFTPLYEEATITSIVLTIDSNYGSSTATLTDSSGNTAGSVSIDSTVSKTVTLTPTNTTGALVYTNVKDGSNTQLHFTQITIYYSLSN